jgi:PAS domain S-box-containing protein
MFEFPPELVESGTPFTDIIRFNAERGDYGPGDVEEIVRERVERVRNFEPNLFEYVGADGTVIEVRREPLPDGGFVSTLTDITERKRAEEEFRKAHDELEFRVQERTEHLEHEIGERQFAEAALRESEERFRAGFEHAAAGITTVDRDRRFLSVNPAFCEMLGYTEEELVAIERTDLTHPDDRAITEVYLRRLWKGEIGNIRWEKRFLHKDGHVVWADAVISMVRDAQGEPLYTFGQIHDITEHKQIEQALKESEENYRDVIESETAIITRFLPDTTLTFVNAAYAIAHQTPADALVGRKWLDWRPEELKADTLEFLDSFTPDSPVRNLEMLSHLSDGTPVWRTWSFRAFFGDDGELSHFQSVGVDITDRKRAEEALRDSEERLRAVIDNVIDGIITIDEGGGIESYSPSAERIFGYSADEIIGQNVKMLMPEPQRSEHDGFLEAYRRTSEAKIIGLGREVEGQRKDGSTFPMEVGVSEVDLGERRLFTGIVRDITKRKRAEDALRKSEERLKDSERTALLGHWEWDFTTKEVIRSDQDVRNFGIEPGQMDPTYEAFLERVHPEDRELVQTRDEAVLKGLVPNEYEFRTLWPDGQIRVIRAKYSFILDDDGVPVRVLGINQDITERKQAEEQLRIAKQAAEEANLAKSQFLSSMSHELRTPLNAILGFGQLLGHNPKAPLEDKQKEYAELILEGGEHLLDLINGVLDLARIESGALSVSMENVDLEEIFQECLNLTDPMAERYGIKVYSEVKAAHRPRVHADYTRLKQVILNLLSNAVKYNRSGGTATLTCEDADKGKVRISVSDTGTGIPKGQHEELFKPFSRLGAEVTDIEGTGIGLTITKQIVELMEGRIGFESREGEGSTFWIELARAKGKRSRKAATKASKAPRKEWRLEAGKEGLSMLYVEDNPANLRLMEEIVEHIPNLRMVSAHNAELGIEVARKYRPDVILMDINLPGMSGIDALKELKVIKETRAIPVVALSANAMGSDIKDGLKAGFHGYLTKPVKVAEVLFGIEAALAEGNSRKAS